MSKIIAIRPEKIVHDFLYGELEIMNNFNEALKNKSNIYLSAFYDAQLAKKCIEREGQVYLANGSIVQHLAEKTRDGSIFIKYGSLTFTCELKEKDADLAEDEISLDSSEEDFFDEDVDENLRDEEEGYLVKTNTTEALKGFTYTHPLEDQKTIPLKIKNETTDRILKICINNGKPWECKPHQ